MSHLESGMEHVSNGFDVKSVVLGGNLLDSGGHNADISAQLADERSDLLSIAQNLHTLRVCIVTYTERTLNALRECSRKTQ